MAKILEGHGVSLVPPESNKVHQKFGDKKGFAKSLEQGGLEILPWHSRRPGLRQFFRKLKSLQGTGLSFRKVRDSGCQYLWTRGFSNVLNQDSEKKWQFGSQCAQKQGSGNHHGKKTLARETLS